MNHSQKFKLTFPCPVDMAGNPERLGNIAHLAWYSGDHMDEMIPAEGPLHVTAEPMLYTPTHMLVTISGMLSRRKIWVG